MDITGEFDSVVAATWKQARNVPGFLSETEFRTLAILASSAPTDGVIVEIGSFKGKSTLALASVARHFGLGPVVSIDPHTSPAVTDYDIGEKASSFDEFQATLRSADLEEQVEVHRAFSRDVAKGWNRKIRMLWIDGDHTYKGAKEDFDLFSPFLTDDAIVALHDTLHEFDGPIRVFVEDILRSDRFGAAGFAHSIGWSQYRPQDGGHFRKERESLARRAARLIPIVTPGQKMQGMGKLHYKFLRSLIPHSKVPDPDVLKHP